MIYPVVPLRHLRSRLSRLWRDLARKRSRLPTRGRDLARAALTVSAPTGVS